MIEAKFRLFYALWPDQQVRQQLALWQRAHLPPEVRLTHPADFHLTLQFLGQVPMTQLAALQAIGQGLQFSIFNLQLDKLGYFAKARVLWAGCREVPSEVEVLQKNLASALKPLGFQPQQASFVPHVTLARKATPFLVEKPFKPVGWSVTQWALVASRPGQSPLYKPLALWNLVP